MLCWPLTGTRDCDALEEFDGSAASLTLHVSEGRAVTRFSPLSTLRAGIARPVDPFTVVPSSFCRAGFVRGTDEGPPGVGRVQ